MKHFLAPLLLLPATGCGQAPPSPAPPAQATASMAADQAVPEGNPPANQFLDEDPLVALEKLGAEFGENELGQVASIYFEIPGINDAGLTHLGGLSALTDLNLSGTRIRDRGLVVIGTLAGLRELRLPAGISDNGLIHLRPLSDLRELYLVGSKISDQGLVHIKALTKLQGLYLATPQVSDVGLQQLEFLPELIRLRLPPRITDAGLARIASHAHLTAIDLSRTGVSDAGLAHLAALTRLQTLNLGLTRITSDGLAHLRGLAQLRYLGLFQCDQVSAAAVSELQQALPECKITR